MNFLSASNNNIILNKKGFGMDTPDNICNLNTDQFCSQNKNINQVWTKENFDCFKDIGGKKSYLRANLSLDLSALKTTWAIKRNEDEKTTDEDSDESQLKVDHKEALSPTVTTPEMDVVSPSHHARRPMNAFLIFCKKHRPIVRQKYPHLENRGVTRILGEWWALLDENEKNCYTALAKEYKDAFFSANPDFKWYKLPAPPLRTLVNRPLGLQKPASPLGSPTQLTPNSAIFTPGKLADESQLGNLTSLMNINNNNNNVCNISKTFFNDHNEYEFNESQSQFVNNNNLDQDEKDVGLTSSHVELGLPDLTKPIKKRFFEYCNNSQKLSNNESLEVVQDMDKAECFENEDNLTRQELMNKVVDSMFTEKTMDDDIAVTYNTQQINKEKTKVTRKSLRACKGKRYAEFMSEGKLFGNKQVKRANQYEVGGKFDSTLNNKIENAIHNKNKIHTPKLDLNDTIKRLAERTNTNLPDLYELEDAEEDIEEGLINNRNSTRQRTESENSEENLAKLQADFNLDLRINSLPSLSYETFVQKKRDSKKRKYFRSKSESSVTQTKVLMLSKTDSVLVGSKKRKNKHNITRLGKPPDTETNKYNPSFNSDLFGLATLAEVAANTEKIN